MIIMQCILTITKLEYEAGLIKQQSTSVLLRFTIRHILNQVHNQPEYLILKQQQEKQVQINQEQQQLHSQVILPSTTTIITATACHQSQVSNISHRNNLGSQKMTSWKLSSLLSHK
jgi:hypothetical protein